MYRDVLGFSITPFMQRVMNINGFFASIMRTGKKSEDSKTSLPPGVPIPILPVDYLKAKPESWIGGEGSYVCPVDSDWGLWFNFTMNNPANTAVLSSVKGMNPITGQRVGGYDLEGYQEDCPLHKKPFSKGRLCTECGFKWPAQNYIASPNKFWIDGFRTPDGNVRQFYFTEDTAKSIPEKVIGKEDCVPAFGFCFYHLKDFKGKYEEGKYVKNEFPKGCYSNHSAYSTSFRGIGYGDSVGGGGFGLGPGFVPPGCFCSTMDSIKFSESERCLGPDLDSIEPGLYPTDILYEDSGSKGTTLGGTVRGMSTGIHTTPPPSATYFCSASLDSVAKASEGTKSYAGEDATHTSSMHKKLSKSMKSSEMMYRKGSVSVDAVHAAIHRSAEVGIGAGAKIKQEFQKSNKSVEDWEKKPAGVIRLYFVFQEEFEKYASLGFNDLKGNETGYLEGLPVGGSHE